MKLVQIQQYQQTVPEFDLSEVGFQQFDLVDHFDMFENPHGLDELSEEDKAQLKLLYTVRYLYNLTRLNRTRSTVNVRLDLHQEEHLQTSTTPLSPLSSTSM